VLAPLAVNTELFPVHIDDGFAVTVKLGGLQLSVVKFLVAV